MAPDGEWIKTVYGSNVYLSVCWWVNSSVIGFTILHDITTSLCYALWYVVFSQHLRDPGFVQVVHGRQAPPWRSVAGHGKRIAVPCVACAAAGVARHHATQAPTAEAKHLAMARRKLERLEQHEHLFIEALSKLKVGKCISSMRVMTDRRKMQHCNATHQSHLN